MKKYNRKTLFENKKCLDEDRLKFVSSDILLMKKKIYEVFGFMICVGNYGKD